MSWRRRQRLHEQEIIKACRYCEGTGRQDNNDRCQACRGSGKARTVYGFPKGAGRRKS